MNTGRSRRSRPPTGMTNLAKLGSTSMSITSIGAADDKGFRVPAVPEAKPHPTRPFTPLSGGRSHAPVVPSAEAEASPEKNAATRSQLLAQRKHERAHFFDKYDLDGDGVVDPYEIRLATLVDLNGDGIISQDEKDYLRDLILAGKLKDISLLKDKRGTDAKRCLTWIDTHAYREEEERIERERVARLERMKHSYVSAKAAKAAALTLAKEGAAQDQDTLLATLLANIDGPMDETMRGMIQKSLHAGHEPMARTMPGRQTPSLEYRAEPLHRTRSEILEERRQKLRAHSSYDLDGDGFVDPIEHFISSMLDVNKDGELSEEEKKNAAAVIERIRKHYVIGLEAHAKAPGVRLHQRDGVVMDGVYPYNRNAVVGDAFGGGGSTGPSTPSARSQNPATGEERDVLTPMLASHRSNPGFGSPSPSSRGLFSPVTGRSPSTPSLADDLRRSRASPLNSSRGEVNVLRVRPSDGAGPTSARPATGMSHLVGL